MKKLCRFYCVDCDNAWLELICDVGPDSEFSDKCDYCGKSQEAEELE